MPGTLPEKHTQHTNMKKRIEARGGGHASCTQHTQTQEDQKKGQCVTQGSLGMKTGTNVQVKEVKFSLFSPTYFKSHQEETTASTNHSAN